MISCRCPHQLWKFCNRVRLPADVSEALDPERHGPTLAPHLGRALGGRHLPGGAGPIPVPGRDATPAAEWAARPSFADEQRILRTGCEPKGQAARRVRRLLAPLPLRVTNGGVRLDATRSTRDTPCRRVGLSKRFLPERSPTWRTSSSRTYA